MTVFRIEEVSISGPRKKQPNLSAYIETFEKECKLQGQAGEFLCQKLPYDLLFNAEPDEKEYFWHRENILLYADPMVSKATRNWSRPIRRIRAKEILPPPIPRPAWQGQ